LDKIPFSVYDFLNYLFAGFLLIAGLDYAFNLQWVVGQKLESSHIAFWVVISYVMGHVNAQWASWLLENKIIRRIGYPSANLFLEKSKRPFKHYRTPLPKQFARRIREKYDRLAAMGEEVSGEDMFLFCYHHVKEQCPQGLARLDKFLNLYGFSRNLSFAAVLVSIFLGTGAIYTSRPSLWSLAGLAFGVAITLFFRYLKFYRHYSIEIFTSFLTGVKEK
jgi:hypothetical protein